MKNQVKKANNVFFQSKATDITFKITRKQALEIVGKSCVEGDMDAVQLVEFPNGDLVLRG